LFGPNKILKYDINIHYSHRDVYFTNVVKKLKDLFIDKFNLEKYDVFFVPGSGSTGVESVLFSIASKINVIGNNGTFKDRWINLSSHYNKHKKTDKYVDLYAQLETSNSSIFNKPNCIVDAVSAFPYYEVPKDTNILITSTNKILSAMPGCAIVLIKKDYHDKLIDEEIISTLNLRRYNIFMKKNQTPTTPPTQIFEQLYSVLQEYDVSNIRKRINNNSDEIVNVIGEKNIIGERRCPVITFKKDLIPLKIAEEFQLYHINTDDDTYQIFTYSEKNELYKEFAKKLSKNK
tara:strand:+ start:1531 stop:2400 length:870 start_codon:yes stop_codon:yes gene_type:complete